MAGKAPSCRPSNGNTVGEAKCRRGEVVATRVMGVRHSRALGNVPEGWRPG